MKKKIACVLLIIFFLFLLFNKILATDTNYIALGEDITLKKGSKVNLDLSNITKTDANVFNHYSIKYSSSIYIKGVITYNMSNGKLEHERFFLEPTEGKESVFSSYINGYVDNCTANNDENVSISFENIDESSNSFTIYSLNLEKYDSVDTLISKTNGSLANSDYEEQKTIFMQGNNITLGISLKYGGGVNYISGNSTIFNKRSDKNLVNRHDNGRLIQQCYYGNSTYLKDGQDYRSLCFR